MIKFPHPPKLENYDLSDNYSFDKFEKDVQTWSDELDAKIKMVERRIKLEKILKEKKG